MKWFAGALLVVIVLLQYRLWFSPGGVRELTRLELALARQQAQNSQMRERNQQLVAEVADLKDGLTALEERARTDLGMIAAHETFYQVAGAAGAGGGAGSPTAGTRTAAAR
jgi:cell division protein FtsB